MSRGGFARRLVVSAGSGTLSQLGRVGATFLTHLVVRRLVVPAEWGLWNWAESLFLVLAVVRDLGVNGQMIRDPRRPWGAYLFLEATWGVALAAAAFAAAPWLAALNHEGGPALVAVLRALALYLVLDGLARIPVTWLEHRMEVGRLVVPEAVRYLSLAAVAIGLATAGFGVWSLVAGHVASTAAFAAAVWFRAGREIPLGRTPGALRPLLAAAVPLAAATLLAMLVQYAGSLLLGSRFPAVAVGNYGFALFVSTLASRILAPAVSRTLYPAFVALTAEPARQFEVWRSGTLALLAVEVPAACMLFVNADLALRLLGGERWGGAAPFLRVLSFAPLLEPWSRFGADLVLARGRDRLWMSASVLNVAALVAAGLALTSLLGPIGMAWASWLPLGGLLLAWGVAAGSSRAFRAFLAELAPLYLVSALLVLPVAWLPLAEWPRAGVSLAAATLALAVHWFRSGRQILVRLREI